MPPITALIHTHNDRLRLGRCLETLYVCDDVLVIDHGSEDGTPQIARAYGSRVIPAASLPSDPQLIRGRWLFCLDPHESLSESLMASLYEWKSESGFVSASGSRSAEVAFSVFLREETSDGWIGNPRPQTRLVPAGWNRWHDRLPVHEPSARVLEGHLLRFVTP
jgi:glycosyltransferase involved in cell wall biosynthesis